MQKTDFWILTSVMQKPDFQMSIFGTSSVRTKHHKRVQMTTYLINLATAPYTECLCTTMNVNLIFCSSKQSFTTTMNFLYLTIHYFSKWRREGHNENFKNSSGASHNWSGAGSNCQQCGDGAKAITSCTIYNFTQFHNKKTKISLNKMEGYIKIHFRPPFLEYVLDIFSRTNFVLWIFLFRMRFWFFFWIFISETQ